jgi:hypothetical protein
VFGKQRGQNGHSWRRDIHFSSGGNLIAACAIVEKLDLSPAGSTGRPFARVDGAR